MRTRYENIHFRFENAVNKIIDNKTGAFLGYVGYDTEWNCYEVRFTGSGISIQTNAKFTSRDLADIAEFMDNMAAEHGEVSK